MPARNPISKFMNATLSLASVVAFLIVLIRPSPQTTADCSLLIEAARLPNMEPVYKVTCPTDTNCPEEEPCGQQSYSDGNLRYVFCSCSGTSYPDLSHCAGLAVFIMPQAQLLEWTCTTEDACASQGGTCQAILANDVPNTPTKAPVCECQV